MSRKTRHTPHEIKDTLEEIEKQTDRGAGIIAAAILDEMLEVSLLARLVELNKKHHQSIFKPEGPLGTFSNKIEMAFALGLLSEECCKQLHTIREIRNRFSHRIESLAFDHPDIAEIADRTWGEEFGRSRRDRFITAYRVVAMLLFTPTFEDIRIRSVGETHPRIYAGVLSVVDPKIGEIAAGVISGASK